MRDELEVNESELFAITTLAKVAGQVTGAELKRITLSTGEGDEEDTGRVRVFLLQEQCVTRSAGEIALRGTACVTRDEGRPWNTAIVTGNLYVNPDHPVRFRVECGVVSAR